MFNILPHTTWFSGDLSDWVSSGSNNWYYTGVINNNYRINSNKIEVDLPGINKESVSVELVESKLNIKWTDREKKEQLISFAVSSKVVEVEAQMENGLLTLTLREKEPEHKKIKIL